MLWIFPDYGGSLLRKAWIFPRLPYRGDKDVCGWQAKRFQFHAKNPCRKFEQRARSEIVSMRWNACNICLRLTFLRFFQNDIGVWSWKVENICYCNTPFGTFWLNIKDLSINVDKLGVEKTAEMIAEFVESKSKMLLTFDWSYPLEDGFRYILRNKFQCVFSHAEVIKPFVVGKQSVFNSP